MRLFGYYVFVAVVVVLIFFLGSRVHPSSSSPSAVVNRGGPAPTAKLAENFDLRVIDRVENAGGGYPPRALGLVSQRKPPSDSWLLDADNDRERFRRIEVALRGLDVHMAEIGVRFGVMHDALERGNLQLAMLEADATIETARIAMLKRPGFGGDEGLKYLGAPQWTHLMEALEAGDTPRSRTAFLEVRQSCMTCHASRGMAFLNDSRLFDSTATFAAAAETAAAPSSLRSASLPPANPKTR